MAADKNRIRELKQHIQRLEQEKNQAERMRLESSRLLAWVGHKLRTPLSSLMGMVQLLQYTGLDKDQRSHVDTAASSAKRMLCLLDEVQGFSLLENLPRTPVRKPFHPTQIVVDTLAPFMENASRKNIHLDADIDPSLPEPVLGDPERLRTILRNLLCNALQATDQGRVRIHLTHAPGKQGFSLIFSVTDTGPGMNNNTLKHVLTPFRTPPEDQAVKTGLGLPMAVRLIELLGGSLMADCAPDEGCAFHFHIPVAPQARKETKRQARIDYPPRKILLAEDDQANTLATSIFLEQYGHSVTCVGTGREALRALAREPFDLVLMDGQMPEMTGLEAIQRIRDASSNAIDPHTPIIAFTALPPSSDNTYLQAGANAYISKPINFHNLPETIERTVTTPTSNVRSPRGQRKPGPLS